MAGRAAKHKIAYLFALAAGVVIVAVGFIAWVVATPIDMTRYEDLSSIALAANGEAISVSQTPGGMLRLRVRLKDVSTLYLDMLVATEDRRFYSHHGVDPIA